MLQFSSRMQQKPLQSAQKFSCPQTPLEVAHQVPWLAPASRYAPVRISLNFDPDSSQHLQGVAIYVHIY